MRGVWDGVGLRLSPAGEVAAQTRIPLAAGRYAVAARVDPAPRGPAVAVALDVAGRPAWAAGVSDGADVTATVEHAGGDLSLRRRAGAVAGAGAHAAANVWLTGLSIRPAP